MKKYINIGKSSLVLKDIKNLKRHNKPDNLTIIEDLSILKLRYKYPFKVKTFIFCCEEEYTDEAKEIIEYYLGIAEESYSISKKTYETIVDKENRQGLLAVVYLNETPLSSFKNADIICVCDSLENAGNLGTIIRTCDSAGINYILNVDSKVNLNNPKIVSSSRGMLFKVQIINISYQDAQKWLLDEKYDIYLGEPELGKNYKEYSYKDKIAIVTGSERYGINKNWYDNPHKKVFIPMLGEMGSLNVGVAASILLYEARMKKNY